MRTKLYALTFVLCIFGAGFSQEGAVTHKDAMEKSDVKAKCNGSVVMTKNYHFEVAFKQDAIAVYLYDHAHNSIPVKDVTGEVALEFRNGEKRTLKLTNTLEDKMADKAMDKMSDKTEQKMADKSMHKMSDTAGDKMADKQKLISHPEMQDHLQAELDLSGVEPGNLKATFTLAGLPNENEMKTTFTELFTGFAQQESGPKHANKKS